MGLFASIASALGSLVAAVSTSGCIFGWIDEPKMPKSMIER